MKSKDFGVDLLRANASILDSNIDIRDLEAESLFSAAFDGKTMPSPAADESDRWINRRTDSLVCPQQCMMPYHQTLSILLHMFHLMCRGKNTVLWRPSN